MTCRSIARGCLLAAGVGEARPGHADASAALGRGLTFGDTFPIRSRRQGGVRWRGLKCLRSTEIQPLS